VGFQCAGRLAVVAQRTPGYLNLVRFDRLGRVVCASAATPADPDRARRAWFQALAVGERFTVTSEPGRTYAAQPAVLTAARATDLDGAFDGAFVAVISLSSLQPKAGDPTLPRGAEVALADAAGRYISTTAAEAFPRLPAGWAAASIARGTLVWYGPDGQGRRRVYTAAPVVDDDVIVVLSAPSPGLVSWARLNPLSGVAFPLLTFVFALVAVSIVVERVATRWIVYLQRIAALYARGRLSVRPVRAEEMPPELRDLAVTMEDMADAILARDAVARDNLAQKDALMREIHHRVKNNLQVISSLLNLQQRALTDAAARAAMGDMRRRIAALALIYRALYQGPDLKRIDLAPFLEELTAQLVNAEHARGGAVRTQVEVDPLVIDPDRLAPLALFAVEAIANALAHGLERGGLLRLTFRVKAETATLEVTDSGGPAGPELPPPGVGRTLMAAFARQLRGQAEVIANDQGGVTARLNFPAPPIAAAAPAPRQRPIVRPRGDPPRRRP
jgi:two-component sensor histidine kinase